MAGERIKRTCYFEMFLDHTRIVSVSTLYDDWFFHQLVTYRTFEMIGHILVPALLSLGNDVLKALYNLKLVKLWLKGLPSCNLLFEFAEKGSILVVF